MKTVEFGKQHNDVIMLLHGGGLSWWNYKAEAELLKDQYHVVLPILDGHAGSDNDFISIEKNASQLISFIDKEFGGSVLLIGGLSLGAQILVEMLTQRNSICQNAIIESASVIPSKLTNLLIKPTFSLSYGLVKKKSFAQMQFDYLHIRKDLFEDYYRDTSQISKENMIAFLEANTSYEIKPGLQDVHANIHILAGEKEQKKMICSAEQLHKALPNSVLEIKKDLYHGEYSINYPEEYTKELLDMICYISLNSSSAVL